GAGNPDPPLHDEGVRRTGAVDPLVIGDRLDTDIESATRRGAHSLLVLSGVTTPLELLLAPPKHRPSYLAHDIGGLNETHPQVLLDGGRAHCGGWTASVRGGRLELRGAGERLDGLRALCVAAWHSDHVLSPASLRETTGLLGW
ncbi:HAD hydrolase-like protein, partial [Thermobifida halotolerans]|uniref:HAD hydrolase-like protein n=1 Tax=Thermobifida halotolerans TaxID=483545 RepID=UPI001F2111A5